MSLQINEPKITHVLLADGWHEAQGFGLDAYEFGCYYHDREWSGGPRFDLSHGGGQDGICAAGFVFYDVATDRQIAGPLTSILAVAGEGITSNPQPGDPDVQGQPSTSG